jgi:hypothetical protein
MKRIYWGALALAVMVQPLFAIDLPNPPAGFTWQRVPELKAAFLKPNGWFFRHEEQKGTLAYFITKESIEGGGDFSTGLTVNVFRGMKDPATERGQALIEQIAEKMHAETYSRIVGPFHEFGCDAKDSESVMHYLTVANTQTNTLYFFIFESPVADWDAAWKLGKQIMDNLALDDGI